MKIMQIRMMQMCSISAVTTHAEKMMWESLEVPRCEQHIKMQPKL